MNSWLNADVALAQKELVLKELQRPMDNPAFVAFKWAIDKIAPKDGDLFLDVGCGCGHYGVLMSQWYPGVIYCGEDISLHMIEVAKELNPLGQFSVRPIDITACFLHDITMVSAVLEYTAVPSASLKRIVDLSNILIIHRARVLKTSGFVDEPTYCGNIEPKYIWGEGEIESIIGDLRFEKLT